MNKRFRACTLEQRLLLPPSLQDWVPENHLARYVADVMNELDLSAIYAEYERKDGRGLSAYHPLLLARLLVYGYCRGVTSSRRIERATYDDVAFRYLAADQHPDHDTIANFRREHLAALAGLFVQVLRLCQKTGLVKLGNVAIDGTKMLANASTRRSVSYQELSEREQHWQRVVDGLLAEAEKTDEEEDQRYGKGQSFEVLPPELANAQSRLERLRQAKAELEQEARQKLEQVEQVARPRQRGRPRRGTEEPCESRSAKANKQLRRARKNASAPTRQYNFVDPDSRVMLDGARKCFIQGYNAQIAADSQAQVIVAAELTQQTTDRQQLVPMVEAVREATGRVPDAVMADAGYWDTSSLHDVALQGIEVLVAPDSQRQPPGGPLPANAPKTPEAAQMRKVLATETGRTRFALRKAVVEPVFGQIKEGRGIRRFRLRGLERVSGEWKLICATHNLLKLFRYRTEPPGGPAPKRLPRTSRCVRLSKTTRFACIACRSSDPRGIRGRMPPVSLRQAPELSDFPRAKKSHSSGACRR